MTKRHHDDASIQKQLRLPTCSLAALAALLYLGLPGEGHASLLTYNFHGTCVSTPLAQGSGCAGFGINDGDTVSGSVSIDSSVVSSTMLTRWDNQPSFGFQFDFGNIHVLIGTGDTLETNMFSAKVSSDLSRITDIFGGDAPFAVFMDSATGGFVYPDFNYVQGYTAGGVDNATARGEWLSTSVPEPTTLALLGLGLTGLALSRRKRT